MDLGYRHGLRVVDKSDVLENQKPMALSFNRAAPSLAVLKSYPILCYQARPCAVPCLMSVTPEYVWC